MVCEFHGSNSNGFGDIWWTDNPIYFSSIDGSPCYIAKQNTMQNDINTPGKGD